MVLSMMKRLPGYQDLQREHRWEDLGPVTSLKNANVLVLGAGDIGGHFATLCRSMGAHVRGIKRHPLVYPIVFEDMDGMDALPERLAEADIVASFMPSTPETRGLANAEFFAAMKPGALFANGGRGDLVVADDLVAALESGHLAGAAVDVTDPEPLPETSPCGMRLTCSLRRISRAGSTWRLRSTMWSTLPRKICVTCKRARRFAAGSNTKNYAVLQTRNEPTLRARRLANLPFNFKGATRRSAPFHFTAPCLKRRALADFCSTCGALLARPYLWALAGHYSTRGV